MCHWGLQVFCGSLFVRGHYSFFFSEGRWECSGVCNVSMLVSLRSQHVFGFGHMFWVFRVFSVFCLLESLNS